MADRDSDTPKKTPRVVPDPHRGEPLPPPDAHTRSAPDADMVRPDQQEELGPVEGLFHSAAVEAKSEVTGDPEDEAEAARLGVEGEGVESAQILSIMVATIVTLGLAVLGVFVLVAFYSDSERVARDAGAIYPELREVERVAAEMQHYSRTDTLYRLPIGVAMSQVAAGYYAQQQGGDAVPAPVHFNTLYLNASRESGVPLWEGDDAAQTDERGAAETQEAVSAVEAEGGAPSAPTTESPATEAPAPTTGNEPGDG